MTVSYVAGALLEDMAVTWTDSDGSVIDFSTGHTFEVKVGRRGSKVFTKTTGITPAATAPNLTVAWAADDLGTLAPNDYDVEIIATRTSDAKPRIMLTTLTVEPGLV